MGTKVILPAGFMLNINNLAGALAKPTEVEFPGDHDIVATEFAIAGRLVDLQGALDHEEEIDGVKKLVKYNPHGSRILVEAEDTEDETSEREKELKAKQVPELKDIAVQLEIDAEKLKKPELIAAILAAEEAKQ